MWSLILAILASALLCAHCEVLQRLEKDRVVLGTFALNGQEVPSWSCSFKLGSGRTVANSYLLRNNLYSIFEPTQGQPGELLVHLTDKIFFKNCQYQEPLKVVFQQSTYAFSISPKDDFSILTTLDSDQAELALNIIDANNNMSVTRTIVPTEWLPTSILSMYSKIFTTFLNNEFMVIQLDTEETSAKDSFYFLFNKSSGEVQKMGTPQFSLVTPQKFIVYPSNQKTQHLVSLSTETHNVITFNTTTNTTNTMLVSTYIISAYRFFPSNPLNLTLDWQRKESRQILRMMYQTSMQAVVVDCVNDKFTDRVYINAKTGSIIFQQRKKEGLAAGGTNNVLFDVGITRDLYVSYSVSQTIFDPSTKQFTSGYDASYGYARMLSVGQSGQMFFYSWKYDYEQKVYHCRVHMAEKGALPREISTFNDKDVVQVYAPTDHCLVFALASGTFSLRCRPPPTPAPSPTPYRTPSPTPLPTPPYTPTPSPTPFPTPFPTPYPSPKPYSSPTPYAFPTPSPSVLSDHWWDPLIVKILMGVIVILVVLLLTILLTLLVRSFSRVPHNVSDVERYQLIKPLDGKIQSPDVY